MGLVVFRALDFGLEDEEERHLHPDLQSLIANMSVSGEYCAIVIVSHFVCLYAVRVKVHFKKRILEQSDNEECVREL